MSKEMVRYKSKVPVKYNPTISSTTLLLGLAVVGLLVWFLLKGRTGAQVPAGNYSNLESWDVQWSDDGLPLKITIHRDAKRS